MSNIIDRIDFALMKMANEGLKVRAICLNEKDREAFSKEMTKRYRKATGSKATLHPCSYGEHLIYQDLEVRKAKHSTIWSVHGVGRSLPLRLPATEEQDG